VAVLVQGGDSGEANVKGRERKCDQRVMAINRNFRFFINWFGILYTVKRREK